MVIALIVVLGILVYTWIVYPVVVMWLGGRQTSDVRCQQSEVLPPVVILFSAHNEEAVIRERLENFEALDYPRERIQVFVGVDGGSDRTAEIALEWAKSHPTVQVVVSPRNHGKTAMLKRLVAGIDHRPQAIDTPHPSPLPQGEREKVGGQALSQGKSEKGIHALPLPLRERVGVRVSSIPLLVFTDANTMFGPDALKQLVAPFADPKVGGVCGRLVFEKRNPESRIQNPERKEEKNFEQKSQRAPREENCISATGGEINSSLRSSRASVQNSSSQVDVSPDAGTDEGTYWNLETRLKAAESSLDSCLGANGAIYAIRAELFPDEFPDNTIIDDFVIGMKIREQGYRMVYEPSAVATEDLPATVEGEWRRRVRIGSGAFQALSLCRRCLLPRYGAFAWIFWSHKVLRWFTPHLLAALLGISFWALGMPSTKGLWVIGYGVLGLLVLWMVSRWCRKGFKLLGYFLTMQAALFAGFLRYCKGGLKGTWERTERG